MTGKTHQIIGISASLTYFVASTPPTYNPATFGAILAFSYIGALLPDIDQPGSKLWNLLPFGHVAAEITDPFLEHRNITHSLLGVAIVGTAFYFIFRSLPSYWGINTHLLFITTLMAYTFHLLADMFTAEGVPLLFPYHYFFGIPPKPFEGIRIVTGKWFENLIIFPLITLYLVIFIWLNFSNFKTSLFK